MRNTCVIVGAASITGPVGHAAPANGAGRLHSSVSVEYIARAEGRYRTDLQRRAAYTTPCGSRDTSRVARLPSGVDLLQAAVRVAEDRACAHMHDNSRPERKYIRTKHTRGMRYLPA